MKKNMSDADLIIRLIIVAVVGVLFYMNIIEGTLAQVLMALANIFLVTSFISFCHIFIGRIEYLQSKSQQLGF